MGEIVKKPSVCVTRVLEVKERLGRINIWGENGLGFSKTAERHQPTNKKEKENHT